MSNFNISRFTQQVCDYQTNLISSFMQKNTKIPAYPALVIFLPFLFFLIGNFYDINFSQLTILLAVPLIIIFLVYIFTYLILRIGVFKQSRLITVYFSIVIFIFFNYR